MKFYNSKCHAPGLHISDDDMIYSAYKYRETDGIIKGVILNADNDIKIGYRQKKQFKAMTANLIMDYKHNKPWPADELQQYAGLLSYYKMVEREYFNEIIKRFDQKFHVDLKNILKGCTAIPFN